MKIGILMCGHTMPEVESQYGDYDAMFARLLAGYGLEFQAWDVENMDFPDSVSDCDGWLLTGSKHGAYEDHPFIAPLEEFIRAANAGSVPMVGICFGHQIIAKALGGRVEKFEGGWSIGRTEYHFDTLGHIHLNAWHQDQVITPPEGATTIAATDFCAHAALNYGDKILTIQPHPELSPPIIAEYVRIRRGGPSYPDEMMQRAIDKSVKPTDDAIAAGEIARFLLAAHAARSEVANA